MASKAPYVDEDKDIALLKSMMDGTGDTKVEKSPRFEDIMRAYLRVRFTGSFSPTKFHRHIVAKLDKEISIENLTSWITKLKRNEKREWEARVKMVAAESINASATIESIRDTAIKVFFLKVQEFLRNPEVLDKMSFSQALQLYDKIEKLHLSTEKLNLEKHDQGRKDVFTIFSMGLMSGKYKEDDINNLLGADEGQSNSITEGTVVESDGTATIRT